MQEPEGPDAGGPTQRFWPWLLLCLLLLLLLALPLLAT